MLLLTGYASSAVIADFLFSLSLAVRADVHLFPPVCGVLMVLSDLNS
jgi:hypothetical protein